MLNANVIFDDGKSAITEHNFEGAKFNDFYKGLNLNA